MSVVRYHLNGQHVDSWDEVDPDRIDLAAAAANLTDYPAWSTLTAELIEEDDEGRTAVVASRRIVADNCRICGTVGWVLDHPDQGQLCPDPREGGEPTCDACALDLDRTMGGGG